MSVCDGRCCAVFSIADEFHTRVETTLDGPYIADMLIPLTHEEALARAQRFGVPESQADLSDVDGFSPYTCRHWDETTRLCTAYEQRPELCRDYPYQHECRHGCGACSPDDVQEKWVKIAEKRRQEQEASA